MFYVAGHDVQRPTHPRLHVRDARDAQIMFEACRLGILKPVSRRLNDSERAMFIKSGSVFVWHEADDDIGLKRWTDGLMWSCSRMREPFLFYEEKTLGDQADAMRSRRDLVGTKHAKELPSTGMLVKQTYSAIVTLPGSPPDAKRRKWHITCYFTHDDFPRLPTLAMDPVSSASLVAGRAAYGYSPQLLSSIKIPPGVYRSGKSRQSARSNADFGSTDGTSSHRTSPSPTSSPISPNTPTTTRTSSRSSSATSSPLVAHSGMQWMPDRHSIMAQNNHADGRAHPSYPQKTNPLELPLELPILRSIGGPHLAMPAAYVMSEPGDSHACEPRFPEDERMIRALNAHARIDILGLLFRLVCSPAICCVFLLLRINSIDLSRTPLGPVEGLGAYNSTRDPYHVHIERLPVRGRQRMVDNVTLAKGGNQQTGTLHLTAHHIIFHETDEQETWIPYPLISLVTRLPQTLVGLSPISVRCRNFENFSLYFEKDQDALDVFDSVRESTVATSVTKLYAFFYQPPIETPRNGWSAFSPREEFARMGLGTRTKAWRLTDINKDYTFCPTYPATLVVPARISDATLSYAAKYRSKARIPALSYLHWGNFNVRLQATITRCSQPMVGLTNNRSVQDEKLIEAVFQSHYSAHSVYAGPPDGRARSSSSPVYGATPVNLLIDARPTANAMANAAKGAGTENMENYKEAKKVYLGIDNIHVMRDSLAKLAEALYEADMVASISASNLAVADASRMELPRANFVDRQTLRRSGWLRHLSSILEGTLIIVKNLHVYSSHALLHCSDGWDRTAQLSSLAQICLDPYFRTIRGFAVLVEKEWLSYGHKFLDRCGHLSSDKLFVTAPADGGGSDAAQAFFASVQNKFAGQSHLKETSPVFHQFLECLWQLQRQFPTRFEYNEDFLIKVHYHLNSCQFGTFLFNCERDRRVPDGSGTNAEQRTHSVWDWFDANRSQWLNDLYDPAANAQTSRDMGVLMPDTKDIRFWSRLYGRSDEEMNGGVAANPAAGVELRVSGSEDDSVLAGAPLLALTPSTTPPLPTPGTDAPEASKYIIPYQPRSPTRPRRAPGSPFSGNTPPPTATRQDSFRPFASTNSAFSMQPANDAFSRVPWRNAAEGLAAGAGGMKSVWASISSNASAAFSAAQAAYENTTKDQASADSSPSRRHSILETGGELPTVSRLGSLGRNSGSTSGGRNLADLSDLGNPWLDEPAPAAPTFVPQSTLVSPTPLTPAASSLPSMDLGTQPSRRAVTSLAPTQPPTSSGLSNSLPSLSHLLPSLSHLTLADEPPTKTRSLVSPRPPAAPRPDPPRAGQDKPPQNMSDIDPLGVGFK
ncbi:hypothetical protein FRC10_011181 [Ceratobasidium sp. 414]|nr:hypothetical protein FRC10_011181 [Ceratobasidium sp. 414]